MAGLLDFLNTDEGRLGMGLLAAGGPRTDPNQTGFGQRLTDAMGYGQAQQDAALKRQMFQQEMRMKQLAEQRAQQQFKNQQDFYNGWGQSNGGSPGQPQTGNGGGFTQQGNGIGMPQGVPQGNQLMMLEKAALAGVPGAKELFDIYKYKNEPQKLDQGATYENRVTGKREFMPKVGEGIGPNGNGGYGELPGYGDSLASIEGKKAAAIETAKARLDPYIYTPKNAVNPILSNRASIMQGTGESGLRDAASGNMGADPAGIQREILATEADLKNPLDPSSRAQLAAYLQDLKKQGANVPAPGGVALQSPAEAAKLLDQAKADIVPTQQRQSAIASGTYLSQVLDMAIKHPGRETATGASGTIDPRNYLPGTDAKNFHVVLDQINGSAFMQAYQSLKGGGQITEVEGKKATDAIARMNTAQSDSEFLKALNEFKGIVDGANTRMGGGVTNQGGATSDFSPVKPAAPVPMKGMVRNGYKFKGGDPANQANWEQQ